MPTNQPPPRIPEPPQEYSVVYMQDLARALEVFISQQRNPGDSRVSSVHVTDNETSSLILPAGKLQAETANLANLPTSSAGLSSGDLWNDSGTVKIVP